MSDRQDVLNDAAISKAERGKEEKKRSATGYGIELDGEADPRSREVTRQDRRRRTSTVRKKKKKNHEISNIKSRKEEVHDLPSGSLTAKLRSKVTGVSLQS